MSRGLIAVLALCAAPVAAHEATDAVGNPMGWHYSLKCCSERDCVPVPFGAVQAGAEGWYVRLRADQHPMLSEDFEAVVPFGDERLHDSGDSGDHVCIAPPPEPFSFGLGVSPTVTPGPQEPRLLCIYLGPRGG